MRAFNLCDDIMELIGEKVVMIQKERNIKYHADRYWFVKGWRFPSAIPGCVIKDHHITFHLAAFGAGWIGRERSAGNHDIWSRFSRMRGLSLKNQTN